MKEKDKENLIRMVPMIILIVSVGTVTNYNLLYVVPVAIIEILIGNIILKIYKRKK